MTGRFIAFLWMIIGLIMFAFFTSTITGLVADVEAEQIILPVEDVYKMVLSEINNTVKLCTVKGVYEEILPSANKNIDILDSISDCYRRFEEQDGTKVCAQGGC